VAYSKAEQREYFQRVTKPKRQAAARESQLAELRALLHVAQMRYTRDPCEPLRRERDRLQNAVDELVAGPELERLRSTPRPDPIGSHAPEVQPAARVEPPIWDWLAERYWTRSRWRLYRGARA
jgi:hypothetical protein